MIKATDNKMYMKKSNKQNEQTWTQLVVVVVAVAQACRAACAVARWRAKQQPRVVANVKKFLPNKPGHGATAFHTSHTHTHTQNTLESHTFTHSHTSS